MECSNWPLGEQLSSPWSRHLDVPPHNVSHSDLPPSLASPHLCGPSLLCLCGFRTQMPSLLLRTPSIPASMSSHRTVCIIRKFSSQLRMLNDPPISVLISQACQFSPRNGTLRVALCVCCISDGADFWLPFVMREQRIFRNYDVVSLCACSKHCKSGYCLISSHFLSDCTFGRQIRERAFLSRLGIRAAAR